MEQRPISDISFSRYLEEEKLMGSKCKKCSAVFVPPRPICMECHASDMEWEELKGTGRLAAFTCISIGPTFMIQEGFNRRNPYCVGVVELDEGGRVDARIEEVDCTRPETIKVGTPLKVKFLHRGDEVDKITYLAFSPM